MTSPAATILIVDDEPQNCKLLAALLRPEGYLTTSVANGEEALASIARQAPDLILLDIMLPGMDGYQVASQVKATAATSSIPIIMVTAKNENDARLAGLAAGAEEFLTKPVGRAELVLRVRNLLRLKAYGDLLQNYSLILEQQVQARTASLRDSELRFRQMAENIRDAFFLYDADGSHMLYVSPAYEEIWGRSRESLYANPGSWNEAIHPEDRASTEEKSRMGVLAEPFELEYRIVRSDGSIRWIESAGFPVLNEGKKVVRIAGIAKDITERKQAERALLQSEAKYRNLIEQAADGMFLCDSRGRYAMVNSRACELLGYTRNELLRMDDITTYLDDEREMYARRMQAVSAGETIRFERKIVRKDGSTFPADVSLKLVDDGMIQIITRDITERFAQEQKISRLSRIHAVMSGINAAIVRIRDRAELFKEACRIIVEHGQFSLGWIAVIDSATGNMIAVAQAGLPEGFGAGSEFFNGSVGLVPAGTAETALREKRTVVNNSINEESGTKEVEHEADSLKVRQATVLLGAKSVITLLLFVEGKTFGILTLYAPERDFFDAEEIKLLNELAGDISFSLEFIAKEEKADYLAYYDVLTGLANRSFFLERVAQYMRSAVSGGHKLAVFVLDIERFKNFNDTLGQAAGDALLRQVAQWLTHYSGDANLLARVGADHFALVLPHVEQGGEVTGFIEKTLVAFQEHPFKLNDAEFRIAFKAGVALYPHDGIDADIVFRHAEAALKKAKADGDRHLFYSPAMTEMVAIKLTLENQMRRALDNGEFVLHYQPKVTFENNTMTGAEALIRWNDPQSGLVPPARFIPVLEETGLIYEVGRWALRKVVDDYLRWRSMGLGAVRIAVNVSPLQLRNRGFIAEIRQVIGANVDAAAGLELEITESLIMEDIQHNIASLRAIRVMGVTIAIDDFGTGFSSLSYLSKLPVDTLKIDRSFINDMTATQEGLALVSTIINRAHSLKLKVVAEGVETEDQSRLLRLLNCDEMQGYLFSKPVPAEIFEPIFLSLPTAA
ncbi:MAG: EAL domain-containing protein [Betaproteobacteria bacterium]